MKCIYFIRERVRESDVLAIKLAEKKFRYITVGIPLRQGERGADYQQDVSFLRRELIDCDGVSLDFFRRGQERELGKRVDADIAIFSDERVVNFR